MSTWNLLSTAVPACGDRGLWATPASPQVHC